MHGYEVPFRWGLVIAVGWGLFWRAAVINVPFVLIFRWLVAPESPLAVLGIAAVQIAIGFAALAIAVKWLFGSGRLGSLKLVFMEQAYYQDLATRSAFHGSESEPRTPSGELPSR